ncbi:hypothetical protein LLY41_02660 [Cytobacillus firmus]|uniref:hypothetical protein n=1 Tax=Cytobacillus firmus TaxID=1399 RepID=UPI0021852252|nr:hypothetical protein [Cytobacillus firmus]URM33403.1 hypothetical protein LLY41_02660 [Cytobacillus firmus]
MKMIQCIADIEELKARNTIPLPYLQMIESEFLNWYEAEGFDESLISFRLGNHSCIYHLENKEDTSFINNKIHQIEYIENGASSRFSLL